MRSIAMTRTSLAVLWASATCCGAIGRAFDVPLWELAAWFAAVALLVATVVVARFAREETLVRPLVYRAAAVAWLAVALAGFAIGFAPGATDISEVYILYFAIMMILAYRAVVARGPRPAMLAVTVSLFAWLPLGALTLMGGHPRHPRPTPVMTVATNTALAGVLLLAGLVATAALVSFRSADGLPTATARS